MYLDPLLLIGQKIHTVHNKDMFVPSTRLMTFGKPVPQVNYFASPSGLSGFNTSIAMNRSDSKICRFVKYCVTGP